MNDKDFNTIFYAQSAAMSCDRQLQFAIGICKALYFDYEQFYALYKWGNTDILLDAINFCSGGTGRDVDIASVSEVLARVVTITPDMDDFGDELASCALNACTAVEDTLQFLIDSNYSHILNIGTYFTDTVYFKILETEDLTMEQVDEHTQMKEARRFLIEQTM